MASSGPWLTPDRRKSNEFASIPSNREIAANHHFSARRMLSIICTGLTMLFLGLWWSGSHIGFPRSIPPPTREGHMYFITPATSGKSSLCQLALSAYVLGYPTPTLVNWGMTGLERGKDPESRFNSHLAKVNGVSDYLTELLKKGGTEDDLVLIVDGYDVWLQLRPDVMLKRYYEVIHRLDQRAKDTFGADVANAGDMRHTVLFGPDKNCWPNQYESSVCWAVPMPVMDSYSYGPHTMNTSHEGPYQYNIPRWLNSGTILGPVKEVRKIYQAALERIDKHYGHGGDQYYFNQVHGLQSQSRLRNNPELLKSLQGNSKKIHHEQSDAQWRANDEFHIGIDHDSAIFQHMDRNAEYASWRRPSFMHVTADATSDERALQSYFSQPLPADIMQSKGPFHGLPGEAQHSDSWADVTMLHNTATHTIPVLLHFSTRKYDLMLDWWSKMWYGTHAKMLREARTKEPSQVLRLTDQPIGGRMWLAGGPSVVPGSGMWSDKGKWLTWEDTCGKFEEEAFGNTH